MLSIDLSGRICLITGAGGGIGQAIVERVQDAGGIVIASDQSREQLDSIFGDTSTHLVSFDVTDEKGTAVAIADISRSIGPPSIVINAAGVASRVGMPFTRLVDEDWSLPWLVNVVGTFNVSKATVGAMIEAGEGAIVNLASVSGRTGFQTSPPYSASKAAVINLTQVMARDLASSGVRVNSVCPGMVLTPFYHQQRLAAAEIDPALLGVSDEEYFNEKARRLIPLGRGQTATQIADAVCFLASPLAASITGQSLNVDGGLVMS